MSISSFITLARLTFRDAFSCGLPLGCGEIGKDVVVVHKVTVSVPDTGLSSVAGVMGSLDVTTMESFRLGDDVEDGCCWLWSWPLSQFAKAAP